MAILHWGGFVIVINQSMGREKSLQWGGSNFNLPVHGKNNNL